MAPPLLALRNATAVVGGKVLFEGVDAAIGRGDRICLVGRNGGGKSTLLRTLAGLHEPDAGERFVQPRTTVAYLPQEPDLGAAATVADHVLGGLPADEDPSSGRYRAEAVLEHWGLDPDRPTAGLSGGEIRRAALARALIGDPEILLLDEPTNHLDLPAIERLEEELRAYRGGLVLVSHDRAFLRALSERTWWLDRGRLRARDEGFAAFDAWSGALLAEEEAELARLEKRIAAETWWSHHGITARRTRNQGRLRALEAMRRERSARAAPEGRVRLAAEAGPVSGRIVIEAKAVAKSLGGAVLFEDFSTIVQRGDRLGIIGPNGAGKTTLLRVLLGELPPDKGEVRLGTKLEVAYFDQRREQLDPEATLWDTLCPRGGDTVLVQGRPRHVVSYLRDFLFRDDQAHGPVKALSGGERNRLLLARILARPSNLLVLDEPTNDLDMDTLDLLQEVLADYAGTLLLVSHDRDFLDRLVTSVAAFEGRRGRLREYAGGYSDYLRQRRPESSPPPVPKAPARPRPAAGKPQTSRPGLDTRLQRELDRLPAKIAALEGEVGAIEAELSDPDLYRRAPDRFHGATERLDAKRAELAAAEERWLELEMLKEADG